MHGTGGGAAHSPPRITVTGVLGIPEIEAGVRLGTLIAEAAALQGDSPRDGDVVVVTQKVVSKAEGRLVRLDSVAPSPYAVELAASSGRDARLTELVLRESASVVRMDKARGIMITETKHGFICANAGIDSSNVAGDDVVSLLPEDPDESARGIRTEIQRETGKTVAVIVSDTFGRPWREGQTNYAIGSAGIEPLVDYRGGIDAVGKPPEGDDDRRCRRAGRRRRASHGQDGGYPCRHSAGLRVPGDGRDGAGRCSGSVPWTCSGRRAGWQTIIQTLPVLEGGEICLAEGVAGMNHRLD